MGRWDAPCADCGTMLPGNAKSLPAGQRLCHPCRRARAGRPPSTRAVDQPRPCPRCGTVFVPPRACPSRRVCSEACGRERMAEGARLLAVLNHQPGPCDDCGALTTRGRNGEGRACDDCAQRRSRARYRRKNAVRRGARVSGPMPRLEVIAARDGWRCHLCRRKVNPDLRAPHRRSATLDHLIPVSAGGTDDAANLALAHWSCNSSRGAGGEVQLALVG